VNTPAATDSQFVTASSSAVPPESLLVRYVKAHVHKGERAKQQADHARGKSEQHFISAGQYLITLKACYSNSWQNWEILLQTKVGLSTGRASELMQLADGRKDLQQLRDATAQRMRAIRAQSSSSHRACDEEDFPNELLEEKPEPERPTACSDAPEPEYTPDDHHRLITALAQSTPESRRDAAVALIAGRYENQFGQVTEAVADLYQLLARAGR
jgi:hypothetical protein